MLKKEELDLYIAYFSERYFNPNADKTYSLNGLKLIWSNNEQATQASVEIRLTQKEDDPARLLESLLFILYRFRTNLYHGEKDIVKIDGQIDNFINANHILCLVLGKMKSCVRVKC